MAPATLGVEHGKHHAGLSADPNGHSAARHGVELESKVTTATCDGYREISYGELGTRVAQLAHGLRQLGVADGDRVATFMWNNQEHLEPTARRRRWVEVLLVCST